MILEFGALRYTTENPNRIEQLIDLGAVEIGSSLAQENQELSKRTIQELRELARKQGIEGYQEMKKTELIAVLEGE